MNALAESTASLSDERLLKEAEGENLTKIAEGTRKLLFATLDRARKARLSEAESFYHYSVQQLSQPSRSLPSTPASRREKLAWVLQRRPQMQEAAFTLQHRNFETMTDADVERLLGQLQHLGVLDELADEERS